MSDRKDIIDCINKKIKFKYDVDEETKKSKSKLISECCNYFKGLKFKGSIMIEDDFVFPRTDPDDKKDRYIYIERDGMIFWQPNYIVATNKGRIDYWTLDEIKKFHKNKEKVLEEIGKVYECDKSSLFMDRKLMRFK